MYKHLRIQKHIIVLIISVLIGFLIFSDDKAGINATLGLLPFFHGFIQLIGSHRRINLIQKIVRILYFIRNVVTSFLLYLTDYAMPINIKTDNNFQLSIYIMIFETLCVFYFMQCRHDVIFKKNNYIFKLSNTRKFNLFFWIGLIFTVVIYNIIPETHEYFTPIFEQDAAVLVGLKNDDISNVGGLKRILYTLFTLFFGFYRLLLPIYFMAIIKQIIKSSFWGIVLCILIIPIQLFFITAQTMTTLINIFVLVMFLVKLYPSEKRILSLFFGSLGLLFLFIVVSLKLEDGGFNSLLENKFILSSMLQAYIPGISNFQGIFIMPDWNLSYLLSDIYNMIPFRNSIFGLNFGPDTTELFRFYNNAGGQIIPLIGQSYYHFGILAPILSVFLVRIAIKAYDRSCNSENYVQYIYYVYLAIFASMTPCFYYFGIFGSTFLTSIILILFISKLL